MAIGYGVAAPKGIKRKTLKGRKDRAESKQKHMVRMLCVARDGDCRAIGVGSHGDRFMVAVGDAFTVGTHVDMWGGHCRGESE